MVAIVTLTGCDRTARTAYTHFEEIGAEGWDKSDPLIFEPWPKDSLEVATQFYDLDALVRYSRRASGEFPMVVYVENAERTLSTDTVIVKLSDSSGRSVGKGAGVCTVTIPISRHTRLTEGYSITLHPLTSASHSKGVLNVGVIMTR